MRANDVKVGMLVKKKAGYPFEGYVVANFKVLARRYGEDYRIVVEMTNRVDGEPVPVGLLHIFSPGQMEESK